MIDDPRVRMEFALADRLRMTVADLRATMSAEEFMGWIAFSAIRKREMDNR